MARKLSLHWTRRALSDLQGILDHIALDKPGAAQQLAQAFLAKVESLKDSPFLGRETTPGLRELVVHRHYLITYRVKQNRLEILQVWHTARRRK